MPEPSLLEKARVLWRLRSIPWAHWRSKQSYSLPARLPGHAKTLAGAGLIAAPPAAAATVAPAIARSSTGTKATLAYLYGAKAVPAGLKLIASPASLAAALQWHRERSPVHQKLDRSMIEQARRAAAVKPKGFWDSFGRQYLQAAPAYSFAGPPM